MMILFLAFAKAKLIAVRKLRRLSMAMSSLFLTARTGICFFFLGS